MRSSLLFQFYYNKASCKCVIVAMHINSTKLHLLKDEESDYLFFFFPSHSYRVTWTRTSRPRYYRSSAWGRSLCVRLSAAQTPHFHRVLLLWPPGLIHVCVFVLCSKASFNRIHSVLMWLFPAPFLWIEPSIFSDVEVIWNMGNLFIDDLKYSAEGKKKKETKRLHDSKKDHFSHSHLTVSSQLNSILCCCFLRICSHFSHIWP